MVCIIVHEFVELDEKENKIALLIIVADTQCFVGFIRRLTPKECWRLQGFSDEQYLKSREAGFSDSQQYNRMVKYASSKKLISSILEKYPHTSNKENRPYAPPGEYSESSAPPVSVAILNAVKQELDKHETELRTQSTFEQIRNSIKAN